MLKERSTGFYMRTIFCPIP